MSQSSIEKTEKNTSLTYIKWYAVVFIYVVAVNAKLFLKRSNISNTSFYLPLVSTNVLSTIPGKGLPVVSGICGSLNVCSSLMVMLLA